MEKPSSGHIERKRCPQRLQHHGYKFAENTKTILYIYICNYNPGEIVD
jgi:hypothetical protein